MSIWPSRNISLDHYFAELYADDDEDQSDSDDHECEDEYNEQVLRMLPRGVPYPYTAPETRLTKGDRDRSRSPLRAEPPVEPNLTTDQVDTSVRASSTENALEPYSREKSSGTRGARGIHRAATSRGHRVDSVVGDPLTEVCINDCVPLESRQLIKDITLTRDIKPHNEKEKEGFRNDNNDVEFNYATNVRGNAVLKGKDLTFQWLPMESFQTREEKFIPIERCGAVECYLSSYDAFRVYWDDGVLQQIVDATNRFASSISSAAFKADWYPTNTHEVLCLFAFWIILGIIRMPTIRSCFSTNPALGTDIFRRIFTYTRYCALERALHFAVANPATVASSDKCFPIRPIISHLNDRFRSKYVLSKDISISESLTLWKGKLDIKKYVGAKEGVSTFELCESATGYLWSFIVNTDKENYKEQTDMKTTAITMQLLESILNRGHRLFMDNQYSSPLLARFLKRNGTDLVGVLHPIRQEDIPVQLTRTSLKQGEYIARHSGDVCILSWLDRQRRVTMISTCHGSGTGLATVPSKPSRQPIPFQPQMALDFKRSMRGADLKDDMLEPYLFAQKRCANWFKKLFKRLLNCSIHNARILLECSRECHLDHLSFRLDLVESILEHHLEHSRGPRTVRVRVRQTPNVVVNHTHWPGRIAQREYDRAKNRKSRSKCIVCHYKNRLQRTAYRCETCNVPLCVENCFKEYHTGLY